MCDEALYRLQSTLLRDSIADAYRVLAKLATDLGWEALLQIRSTAFVMEARPCIID